MGCGEGAVFRSMYQLLMISFAFDLNVRQIPVAARSMVKVCERSIAGIAGSNPAEVMDVRRLCLLCR